MFYQFVLILPVCGSSLADFWDDRKAILQQEALEMIGSSIKLTDKEQKVNDILMQFKLEEYDKGVADPSKFLPAQHFFRSKSEIEKSEVFRIIQTMPKGASLHSHFVASGSFDLFNNLTYFENLYGCQHPTGIFKMRFYFGSVDGTDCEWKLLSEWRNKDAEFDNFLIKQLSLVVDDHATTYNDINTVWTKFIRIFSSSYDMFKYRPLLRNYIHQVLQEFYDDNVIYLEIKDRFGPTFDENQTYDSFQTVDLYKSTLEEFQANHPDFVGLGLISAPSRKLGIDTMKEAIELHLKLQETYPKLMVGFDLVSQEDAGQPLSYFADLLLTIANRTKFFLHAGETNWFGVTDLNLVDAILLNTSRIGHGFALFKHPVVLRLIKEKKVPIELNPISNQVLKLLDDLRNHVGASLIAGGFPVVVTCDDPAFWGSKGLSYDWYLVFMGMTPRNGDLKILKELALNSLKYSALDEDDRERALAIFHRRWGEFLDKMLEKYC